MHLLCSFQIILGENWKMKYLVKIIMNFHVLAIACLLASAGVAQATTVLIGANVNIFKAGQTPVPGEGTGPEAPGDGVVPITTMFTAGAGQILSFSSVTGSTECCLGNTPNTNPDGIGGPINSSNVASSGGISGISAPGALFLVGLFLDTTNLPSGVAPASLNYISGLSTADASFSPLLNQTFFIGDGLTGDGVGSIQSFVVPTFANALILGVVDSFSFSGPPGYFNDNSGTLEASFSIEGLSAVPVPAALPLFGTGLVLMGFLGWRKKRRET